MRSLLFLLLALLSGSLSAQEPTLLLFGGDDHKTFLGCLNCGQFDSTSVCNRFGDYGSEFSDKSIWNTFGEFGSKFSDYSPWNRYAANPPIVVDEDGQSYGYFTVSKFHPSRTQVPFLLVYLNRVDEVNKDLVRARELFCKGN